MSKTAPDRSNPTAAIADNFLALASAQAVAMAAGLLTTAWLARALEPAAFGILGFGAALMSYFGLLVVFGTDRLVMREIARDRGALDVWLPRLVGLRFAMLAAVGVAAIAVIELIDQPERVRNVMRIQMLSLLAAAIALDFVYQGLQRMRIIGLRQAASSVLVAALTLALVASPDDLYIAAALPHGVLIATGLWLAWRLHRTTGAVRPAVDLPQWAGMLRRSLPMAATGLTATIYLNIDILMLGLIVPPHEVGLYAGAARIFAIAGILGGLLVGAFLPSLAALWGRPDDMRERYRSFATAMLYIGLPIAAAGAAFAPSIVTIVLGGGFAGAATVLSILMLAAGFNYLNQVGGATLLAWNGERTQMCIQSGGAVFNVALNLALIPRFGMLGAAAATLATEMAVCGLFLWRCRRAFGVSPLPTAAPLGVAAAVSVAAVLGLNAALGGSVVPGSVALDLAANIALAGGLYVAGAWAAGIVDPHAVWVSIRQGRGGPKGD